MNPFDILVDLYLDLFELDSQDGMSSFSEGLAIARHIDRLASHTGQLVKDLAYYEAREYWTSDPWSYN